jgi:hypothetical protein
MPALGLGIGVVFRHGVADRPQGSITIPADGFVWTVGDVVTISGTCVASDPRTIVSVVPQIRGVAIGETAIVNNTLHTWTVDHTVISDDVWAVAELSALITDSHGRASTTRVVSGVIYPVEGDSYTYVYDSLTGEFCTDGVGGAFPIFP